MRLMVIGFYTPGPGYEDGLLQDAHLPLVRPRVDTSKRVLCETPHAGVVVLEEMTPKDWRLANVEITYIDAVV